MNKKAEGKLLGMVKVGKKLKSDYSFKKISNAIVKFYKFNNKTYNAFSAQSI